MSLAGLFLEERKNQTLLLHSRIEQIFGAMKTRRMKIPRMKIPRIEYSQNAT